MGRVLDAYKEVTDYLSEEHGEISVDYEWFDEDHCWILFRSRGDEEDEFYELLEENNPAIHVSEFPEVRGMGVEEAIEQYTTIHELSEEEYEKRGETQIRNQQTHRHLGPGSSPFRDLEL
ncbi:hypothetical protein [Candidatus Nanohalovita haloferacivicina]|uniref:hypothetical protein n=1 Tax=Candidatus Nanohalovita haloferacivicina TaxID=2978046 RepID=UPI00325F9FB1|nr:hypothetical protein HBNXNv_0724 [Candidatus Nanohalobia archaeon BNXNv]